ncbi:AAA family ATPase [Candidatus Saccharibacteria bacterium]|nr:AAA family ATPase [Candidatus Saccharibacteria bacterium]
MRQKQALAVMLDGQSVFLTGAPGAGKTYVLNMFIERAKRRGKRVAVTASTGIAATHIGGNTIHSWSGLGIKDYLSQFDLERLKNNDRLIKRYNSTDVLVIDEVSMLHGKRLDMVNQVCKLLRENDQPFGGLQVVLVGDLFQLPPVSRNGEPDDFVHRSVAWQELAPQICYLTEQHRQTEVGDGLLDLLEAMRRGDVNELHEALLQSRLGKQPDQDHAVTKLYSHNIDVDSINNRQLQALPGQKHTYQMTTSGSKQKIETFTKSLLAPVTLTLAVDAEVMFVVNNPAKGFYNGSRGRVVDFDDEYPVVELYSGREVIVEPHDWSLVEDGKTKASATQLPLRLAWAITIHKSQGMSLDAAIMDLSRSFTPGMGYVALSRVRSIDGVYLAGINNMALQLHPDIYTFDTQVRESSNALATVTEDAPDSDPEAEAPIIVLDDELLRKLKAWRLKRAKADSLPAYIIAHDSALEALAVRPPTSIAELRATKGFGPKKAEAYGEDILSLIHHYQSAGEYNKG